MMDIAVATVLSNWHNVLRAISMASSKIPVPKEDEEGGRTEPLPHTLVRIPTQHAGSIPHDTGAVAGASGE